MSRLHVLQLVPVDMDLATRARHLAVALRLRGVDAVYLALAVQRRLTLTTWDREQLERGRSVVDVLTPEAAAKR